MIYTTLITTPQLALHLDDRDWTLVDCRFALADIGLGRRAYLDAHIPGAIYAHLDEDLSGSIVPGITGRHPLPDPEVLATRLSQWGIGPGVQVVVYDDQGGAYAVRLWWMLRWLGHEAVAVLDGGWRVWKEERRETRSGQETRSPREFRIESRPELLVTADEVDGHIPGALSAPYAGNLGPDGRLLAPDELAGRFERLLGDVPAARTICYCGSGVTAAHDLLAMLHAGLGEGRLYVGSWSEWITDPGRPVAIGP